MERRSSNSVAILDGMEETTYRCPGPFPSPIPDWVIWVIFIGVVTATVAIGLPAAIEAARQDAIRNQPRLSSDHDPLLQAAVPVRA
jgi:hypothetical protein